MLKKNLKYLTHAASTETKKEMEDAIKLLKSIKNKKIAVFGSHNIDQDNKFCIDCERLSYNLGKKGYAILSGGGPGIMYAANHGAYRAGAPSVALREALLRNEYSPDTPYTHLYSFKFMFVRRFALSIDCEALIFYPGGFGTLNELFEFITIIQTGLVDKVPIILVDKRFWKGLFDWVERQPMKHQFLNKNHLRLVRFADDEAEVLKMLRK